MKSLRALSALLPLLLAAVPLAAQGIVIPECRDCRRPWIRETGRISALPVESVQIETRIDGQVATTHVTQVFRNPTGQILEGTFFFPIPAGSSVSEFAIWDGDRKLVGEVRPREEARRIYDEIVRRVRDPGLLEYAGENLFQASIFPINPRSTKKLELTYTQVLRAENGTVAYQYPLGTGRNASPIERFSGTIELRANEPVRTVYSPSHQVDVRRREGDRRVNVSFEGERGTERRDFQLFYAPSAREVGMSLFTYREPGKDGYYLLLLSPRSTIEEREYAAKDVVFVMDISGSMNEEGKMEKARRALVHGINGLRSVDRFNVIAFSGETRLMETGLVPATEAGRRRGTEWVQALRAQGGTNINDALVESLGMFPRTGTRPRLLVFMTDGLPTVGETDVERIVANAARARRDGLRLFTFGVGYDVNTRLLDRVAAENGGTADYVAPREDLEVKVSNFFDKVNHPVLTNLRLDLGPVRSDLTYPRQLPDLFKGSQMALVGRYRNEQELAAVTIRLSGNASPTQTFSYPGQRFPMRDERNDWLPRLWAVRRVGWLMEQVRSHGENRELRDEIVDLGTRFGIVTPYTSYLALEPGAQSGTRDFSGVGTTGGVAQDATRREAPRDRRGSVSPSAPPPPPAMAVPDMQAQTGRAAVEQSQASRSMQEALSLESIVAGSGQSMQRVGDKTFYLREGVWTDAEIKADARLPETAVTFGSEEFFALTRRIPALARYFALGEQVAVIHDGRIYRMRAAAP